MLSVVPQVLKKKKEEKETMELYLLEQQLEANKSKC
jgi:hypothetical protein